MTTWQVQSVSPDMQGPVGSLHGTPLQHCELAVQLWP
jgi:hypothetical protein